jgi:hypothetical protein
MRVLFVDGLEEEGRPLHSNNNPNPAGAAIVNTLGPLRQFVAGPANPDDRRYLAIVPLEEAGSGKPVQIQLSSSP